MTQSATDNILAIAYLLMWVATLGWYLYKRLTLDAGCAIIMTYVMYALFALSTINDPLFSIGFEPLKLFPYIYLYVMLMIALSPVVHNHLHPAESIEHPPTRVLTAISLVIIVSSLFLTPGIIANFGDGFVKLFTDTDAGKDAYEEGISEVGESGSAIRNLPAVLYNALSDMTFFLFFYFLSKKKRNPFLLAGLCFAMIVGILMPIMQGLRGGVIISVLTALVTYLLFKPFLSRMVNRVVRIAGVASVVAIALPIAAITVSRFGSSNAGVTGFMNWYIGQGSLYFNNYGLDAGGIRYGDRTFNLFKRAVDSDTSKNYMERRDKFHNLEINDDRFTTFVGDFTIDFGPVAALILFIVFNLWVLLHLKPRDGTLRLHQMLLLYVTACICMQGGMSLYTYADGGNLRLVVFILLYAYLRYHEALLEKFPLKTKEEP